jgi:hypothetical protein
MSLHRTANGKTVDMAALRAKNQNVRAVGNMNVDAAGNTLDSNNEVIADSTRRVNSIYNKTKVNPGAVKRNTVPAPAPTQQVVSQSLESYPPVPPVPHAHVPTSPAPAPVPQQPALAEAAVKPVKAQPQPEITKQEISELTEFDSEEPVGKPATKKK